MGVRNSQAGILHDKFFDNKKCSVASECHIPHSLIIGKLFDHSGSWFSDLKIEIVEIN